MDFLNIDLDCRDFVYVLRFPPSNILKVGTSQDLKNRFKQYFRRVSDGDIILECLTKGGREMEKSIHGLLGPYRILHEVFSSDAPYHQHIRNVLTQPLVLNKKNYRFQLDELLHSLVPKLEKVETERILRRASVSNRKVEKKYFGDIELRRWASRLDWPESASAHTLCYFQILKDKKMQMIELTELIRKLINSNILRQKFWNDLLPFKTDDIRKYLSTDLKRAELGGADFYEMILNDEIDSNELESDQLTMFPEKRINRRRTALDEAMCGCVKYDYVVWPGSYEEFIGRLDYQNLSDFSMLIVIMDLRGERLPDVTTLFEAVFPSVVLKDVRIYY